MLSRHTRLSHPRPVAAATAPGPLTSGRDDTRFFARNVRRGFAADDDEVDQEVELPVRFPRLPIAVHTKAVATALEYGLFDLERLERLILRTIARDYFVLPGGRDTDDDD